MIKGTTVETSTVDLSERASCIAAWLCFTLASQENRRDGTISKSLPDDPLVLRDRIAVLENTLSFVYEFGQPCGQRRVKQICKMAIDGRNPEHELNKN